MGIIDSKTDSTVYQIYRQRSKKKYRTWKYETRVWLDDITVVTRGDKDKHREKLFQILKQLLQDRYKASEKKSEFFSKKTFGRDYIIYIAKFIPKLSEKTNRMKQLLRKKSEWK